MKFRKYPHLYQINALIFLRRLSEKHGRRLTLVTIPDAEWLHLKKSGVDLVWLMGVWHRSPAGKLEALSDPQKRYEYIQALPHWKDEDIEGSPYAIFSYRLHPELGVPDDLIRLRQKLNGLGLGLILDFVPNHMAMDHPWTKQFPDRFVRARAEDLQKYPDEYFRNENSVWLAHGRDPYFPPWKDTVQVNFFSEELRQVHSEILLGLAEAADGIRCDMAMLGLNEIFERVWGPRLGNQPRPQEEYWMQVMRGVKNKFPDFIFIAEVYWNLEWTLQEAGFHYTYDKVLYDRILNAPPADILGHLSAEPLYQNRSMRFIENHDETRIKSLLGRDRSSAAAVIMMTVPGMRMIHDGQMEGKMIHLPIQMGHEPRETPDPVLAAFYEKLMRITDDPVFHEGEWALAPCWPSAQLRSGFQNILAWTWKSDRKKVMVAVNESSVPSSGRIIPDRSFFSNAETAWTDEFEGTPFAVQNQQRNFIQGEIPITLPPWGFKILTASASGH